MAREIEFLSGPEHHDGDDDEPAAPPPRRQVPIALWAVAVVLAIAAAVVWIVTRPTASNEPAARPTRTATVTAAPSPSAGAPVVERMCVAGPPISTQLQALARRNLPGLELLPYESFRCTMGAGAHRRVVSESIAVRYRDLIVEIQATRRVGDSGLYLPSPSQPGLVRRASAESQSAGLNVLVEAYGRPRSRVVPQALSDLASDVSLQLIL